MKDINESFEGFLDRFNATRMRGHFGGFRDSADLFAHHLSGNGQLVCTNFNSVRHRFDQNNESRFFGEIGSTQIELFDRIVAEEQVSSGAVKIACTHYPVFQSPAWFVGNEEPPVRDQASFISALLRNQSHLVLSGHSHYSGLVEYNSQGINIAGGSENFRSRPIINLSLPTLGGEPHDATPFKQAIEIEIGAYDRSESRRSVTFSSWVYNSSNKTWVRGETVNNQLMPYLHC